jgi:hypothetical protein
MPSRVKERARHILAELKGHAPFTCLGAILGIVFMLVFRNIGGEGIYTLFLFFHPAHVVLSAMVTASMFQLHVLRRRFLIVLFVGYFGSIGIATLSDIVIPHIGAELLGLNVPTHSQLHHHEEDAGRLEHSEHIGSDEAGGHEGGLHLGFIEQWYIVNPAAVLGVLIAFFLPRTKFPHAGHVLISTWASSSYLLMTVKSAMTIATGVGIFATLFIAVWLPCCISDIVFPLLFVKSDIELKGICECTNHVHHSHPHEHIHSEQCPAGGDSESSD